jgi:elongation factor 2
LSQVWGDLDALRASILKGQVPTEDLRTITIIAHVDHGKSTLSDQFCSQAQLMKASLSGDRRMTDMRTDQQKRGITIVATSLTLPTPEGLVLNLADCPGHADFQGHTQRCVRVTDVAIVLVDAVEGAKAQTESALRIAVRENVRLILFINKVDRYFLELKKTYEMVLVDLARLLDRINDLVQSERDGFRPFSLEAGNVIIGSGLFRWAVGPMRQSHDGRVPLRLKEVFQQYETIKKEIEARPPPSLKTFIRERLAVRAPLYEHILWVLRHKVPGPRTCQAERAPFLTKSERSRNLISTCAQDAPFLGMVYGLRVMDELGVMSMVKVFSGTLRSGLQLFRIGHEGSWRVSKLYIMLNKMPTPVTSVGPASTVLVQGLPGSHLGQTLFGFKPEPEDVLSELIPQRQPVVSCVVKNKNSKDLNRLRGLLVNAALEDHTLSCKYEESTQQHIISGVGNLQLEIVTDLIQELGISLQVGRRKVLYRESIGGPSTEDSDRRNERTGNKLNDLWMRSFALPEELVEMLQRSVYRINDGALKKVLTDKGIPVELARRVMAIHGSCLFFNGTHGVQFVDQMAPVLSLGFYETMLKGPLIQRPAVGVGIVLTDAKFHPTPEHRQAPSEMVPAVKALLRRSLLSADPFVLEPIQKGSITGPVAFEPKLMREIRSRRGNVQGVQSDGKMLTLAMTIPLNEMTDISAALMSITGGKATLSLGAVYYRRAPDTIRQRILEEDKLQLAKGRK